MQNYKTFDDLEFEPHPNHRGGIKAVMHFDKHKVSIIQTPYTRDNYEMAIMDGDSNIIDILEDLAEQDVTRHMQQVQELEAV